ncbi:replication initiation protein (plasmid) [Helicobacter cetorum MIT 00-7128]|uniref:Replication initiation protein n=1 Tax=Helicobacter cetorum (strain ATCC BAA-429 / MIT 00-7128) TaxID=182217 RepID=I0EQ15_HELC0|nr:replication initiation protein [Helicobacter cetorum MIT 00-7128]
MSELYKEIDLPKNSSRCFNCGKILKGGIFKKLPYNQADLEQALILETLQKDYDKNATYENLEQKVMRLKSYYCMNKFCPVCAWKKSNRVSLQLLRALALYAKDSPNVKLGFLFLTLTCKNPKIEDLSECVKAMNTAWFKMWSNKTLKEKGKKAHRLSDRILGYFRATEFLGSNTPLGQAHPHFHVLLVVNEKSYFGKNYISQAKWLEMWQRYFTYTESEILDIRKITPKFKPKTKNLPKGIIDIPSYILNANKSDLHANLAQNLPNSNIEVLEHAIKEVSKYCVKGDKIQELISLFNSFVSSSKLSIFVKLAPLSTSLIACKVSKFLAFFSSFLACEYCFLISLICVLISKTLL